MKTKKILYHDELNDDFSNVKRKTVEIGDDFKYINKNIVWNILAFIIYRLIMTPFAFLFCKIKFNIKIKNKKILRKNKTGYFIFGNHTQIPGDGFIPSLLSFPKKTYVVVHPDNISLKGTKNYMLMIGAFPTPDTIQGTKKFLDALMKRSQKNVIAIYPEAHIWPYYTGIRPFSSVSFKYPIKFDKPVFCFTVTYQKRKVFKKPKMVVYVDGPFLKNENLSNKEQQNDLRNQVYEKMIERSKNSDLEYIKYEKADEGNE